MVKKHSLFRGPVFIQEKQIHVQHILAQLQTEQYIVDEYTAIYLQ